MGTEFDVSLADSRDRQVCPGRGRPRSEAVERAIIEGVMKLLEDGVPLADISIERLARTAGVGKATIYRRWSGKEELFVDVLRGAEQPGDTVLDRREAGGAQRRQVKKGMGHDGALFTHGGVDDQSVTAAPGVPGPANSEARRPSGHRNDLSNPNLSL